MADENANVDDADLVFTGDEAVPIRRLEDDEAEDPAPEPEDAEDAEDDDVVVVPARPDLGGIIRGLSVGEDDLSELAEGTADAEPLPRGGSPTGN